MGLAVDVAPQRRVRDRRATEGGRLPVGTGPVERHRCLGDEGGDERVGQLDVSFVACVAQRGAAQTGRPNLEDHAVGRVFGVLDRALRVQVGRLRVHGVHPTIGDVALLVGNAVIGDEDNVRLFAADRTVALRSEVLDDPGVTAAGGFIDRL